MSRICMLSSAIVTMLLVSSVPGASWAQSGQPGYAPPGYAAPPPAQYPPPPGYYAPQPYPPQAYAPSQPIGFHEHDGFYMRFLLGPGYMHSSASYGGSTSTISGAGLSLGMAFGGIVAPNVAIYGELLATSLTDPTVDDGTSSGTANGLTVTVAGFGPGVTYYLDNNAYLSGTLLFNRLSFSDTETNDNLGSTDLGVGAQFTFGKEWWVTWDWALGIAGQVSISSIKERDIDYRWTTMTASLMFSATYN